MRFNRPRGEGFESETVAATRFRVPIRRLESESDSRQELVPEASLAPCLFTQVGTRRREEVSATKKKSWNRTGWP